MLSTLGSAVAGLGLVAEVVMATVHCVALVSSKFVLYRRHLLKTDMDALALPEVSIVKPLLGVSPELERNLESFFLLDYPCNKFEILFCVTDPQDPAIDVVRCLRTRHCGIKSRLFIGGKKVGANPKINNIMPAMDAATSPWLWIADAGLYASAMTLRHLIDAATPTDVGIVHQAPFAMPGSTFASRVFEVFFGTAHSRIYLLAAVLNVNCVNGMSIMMRKSALDDIGGLSAFASYIAEDFFIAEAFLKKKWKLALCDLPAIQNAASVTLRSFAKRMTRWIRLRCMFATLATIFEPLSECILLGCLFAWALHHFWQYSFLAVLAVHLLAWMMSDFTLLHRVADRACTLQSFLSFVLPWFCRELMAIPVYLYAMSGRHIMWGGHRYKLLFGGHGVRVH